MPVLALLGRGGFPFRAQRDYDFNVYSREKYFEKLRYMHRNPVKRGLCAKPEDWLWRPEPEIDENSFFLYLPK
ncbi:MAG: hypothetical protein ACM3JB_22555 [Acidobacteriaceae bacterium]